MYYVRSKRLNEFFPITQYEPQDPRLGTRLDLWCQMNWWSKQDDPLSCWRLQAPGRPYQQNKRVQFLSSLVVFPYLKTTSAVFHYFLVWSCRDNWQLNSGGSQYSKTPLRLCCGKQSTVSLGSTSQQPSENNHGVSRPQSVHPPASQQSTQRLPRSE